MSGSRTCIDIVVCTEQWTQHTRKITKQSQSISKLFFHHYFNQNIHFNFFKNQSNSSLVGFQSNPSTP